MSSLATFPVVELQTAWLLNVEQMGSKSKRWVRLPHDPQLWLFKFSRESAGAISGEHWAEKIAAEVATLLTASHARVELARVDGQWGALCRKFDALARDDTELVHGNDLLAGHVTGYDRTKQRKQSDHTVKNVIRAIGALFNDETARDAALTMLAGYLVLDALILNTDRHHENWGVLRRVDPLLGVSYEIAPSFDHASSLARNEPSAKLAGWLGEGGRAAWYAGRSRCNGGLYWSERDPKGANPLKLAMDAAQRWPRYFEPWRVVLAGVSTSDLESVVNRMPVEAMPPESKRFALALMTYTLGQLKQL